MQEISQVAVLGAGVMGSQLAAHLANCGVPSILLDIVPPDLSAKDRQDKAKRDRIAARNKQALLDLKPPPLYRGADLDLITVGNIEDDMARIGDCEWILETVTEDLDAKRSVFEQVPQYRSPGAVVTTNTSGLPLKTMVDVMDEDTRRHFLGTHFFNPPRYLKLVELIPGPDTLPELMEGMAGFVQEVLGKGAVRAKDTPNFIANRIGTFTSQFILHEMTQDGLTFEEVDLLTGRAIGHATSATLRTLDLIGLDTYLKVVENVYNNCPDDERRDLMAPPDWLRKMVEKGLLGAKAGAGFYKKTESRDKKGRGVILTLDLNTFEYRDPVKPRFDCVEAARKLPTFADKMRIMYASEDRGSQFLWRVFANAAVYTANRIPEIADDIVNIDNALKWGFGRQIGIFETWDALGVKYVCDRMRKDGLEIPAIAQALLAGGHDAFYTTQEGRNLFFDIAAKSFKAVPGNPMSINLAEVKQSGAVVKKNDLVSLIDLGDGILCAELHSKRNFIDLVVIDLIMEGVMLLNEGRFEGMVLGNQGTYFSAGANLMQILRHSTAKRWDELERLVTAFQRLNMAMRFCKRPIVAAPHHNTFGGGIEMCQHTARVVIAGETYGGLVEAAVGLVPGGGGCKEMLRRALACASEKAPPEDPFPHVRRAFETIAQAKVSTNGPELISLGYFTDSDVICRNLDHQVRRAKEVCRDLAQAGYEPPKPATLTVLGEPGRTGLLSDLDTVRPGEQGTEHDALVAEKLAHVLTGGDRPPGSNMAEQDVLDLAREAFLSLCAMEKSQQRMRHMLATGRPLRN